MSILENNIYSSNDISNNNFNDISLNNTKQDLQQVNAQLLLDIQSLQNTEKDMLQTLESPNTNADEQTQLIEKINNISKMRMNLYNTLNSNNLYYQDTLSQSQNVLKDQSIVVKLVEENLNRIKKEKIALDEDNANQVRLIQINNYYGQKYAEHSLLLKNIIYILIPIIILTIMYRNEFLPNFIFYALIIIITIIGGYYFWIRWFSIIRRDNMNYQKYDWYFDAATAEKNNINSTSSSTDPWISSNLPGTCIGKGCCSNGLSYDNSINQCISSVNTSSTTTETFQNGLFKHKHHTQPLNFDTF